jgi:DNA-binding PadR family transcriptional regulator
MHPYEIQRLIREWHKEEFLVLKRGSLYHAIERLQAAGLIDPVETSREGRRPERTIYRLTEAGEQAAHRWLRKMLAQPARDSTELFAALSFLSVLAPRDVAEQLEERARVLAVEIAGWKTALEEMVPRIGRLPMIEVEYARAMREAELAWVKTLLEDVRTGALHWDPEPAPPVAAQRIRPGEGPPLVE